MFVEERGGVLRRAVPMLGVLVCLGVVSTPVSAAVSHKYLSQLTGFGNPTAVTVAATGDVYVVDTTAKTVDRFSSTGAPLAFAASSYVDGSKLTGTPTGPRGATVPFEEPDGVAVDDESGKVYVSDGAGHVVDVFGMDGEYKSQLTGTPEHAAINGPFQGPKGLAVDQTTHDLYVTDPEREVVDVFSATGAYVRQFGVGVLGGAFGESVAVNDLTEDAYVGDSGADQVFDFGSTGEFLEPAWEGASTPNGPFGGGYVYVGLDSATGHVYVAATRPDTVDEFDASASEEYLGQLTGTPSGPFTHPQAVAVNPADGDLYVADQSSEESGVVDVFGPDIIVPGATVQSPSSVGVASAVLDGSVDPEGIQVTSCKLEYGTSASYGQSVPCEQTPAQIGAGEEPVPVAATLSGLQPNTTYHYRLSAANANGSNTSADETFITTGPPGVGSEASENIGNIAATLSAKINPDGLETQYHFEYGTSPSYGESAPIPSGSLPAGFTEEGVSASLTRLSVETTYHFRVVATNAASAGPVYGPDQTFTTLPPALIDNESVSRVTAMSATLQAQINPLGDDTHYYFEYGTSSCVAGPSSCAAAPSLAGGLNIGSADSAQGVNVPLQGLRADTTYHYRAVATNGLGNVDGVERTFTTQSASGSLTLLDGRAWEMVSPVDKYGGVIEPLLAEGGAVQASAEGDAFTYLTDESIVAHPVGNTNLSQVISTRGVEGWSTQDIATPHESQTGERVGQGEEYRIFSPDLSVALVEPYGPATPLPPEVPPDASERTIYRYLRSDSSDSYQALVTAANAPGAHFGGDPEEPEGSVHFVSATPDLSHVVLRSEVALTAPIESGLYEWTAAQGQLQPASVLPDEEAVTGALGYADIDVRHAISNDGSRIVWSERPGTENLFMRDMTKGETVQLNSPEPGLGSSSGEPIFQTASEDGSRVFFTDGQRLTSDSRAEPQAPDLYEFEVTSGDGPLAGKVKDLTAEVENAGELANVQGSVLGAGEDGGQVYFVATGVLSSAENGDGERALTGADNLYALHYDDERQDWEQPVFIATLSSEDRPDWEGQEGEPGNLHRVTSRVSPGGRYLAFMSERRLMGYDNTDANSDQPDEEVYLYDASSNRLVCASCDPTGARPVGVFDLAEKGLLVDPLNQPVWAGHWLAASIPGWTATDASYALYQARYLDDSGRLFFDSPDALVTRDINGLEDVYEYEPQGVGTCAGTSETFSESSNGCVGLLSSGESNEESVFLDASENGSDVFFLTTAQLVPQDDDQQYDVYDARECTQASPCLASSSASVQSCESAESCEGAASPQSTAFATPPSATFSGAGNIVQSTSKSSTGSRSLTRAQNLEKGLRACKREAKSKRSACERRVERRYGPVHKAKKKKKAKKSRRGE